MTKAQWTILFDRVQEKASRNKLTMSIVLAVLFSAIALDSMAKSFELPTAQPLEEVDITKQLIDPRPTSNDVLLVVIADHETNKAHQQTILTQKCYAQKNGYEHHTLDPEHYLACQKYRLLEFRKICALKTFLEDKPDNLNVLVLNEYTLGNIADTNLDTWLSENADLTVFERVKTFEWSHSTFMLKNSLFMREFLRNWADYEYASPLSAKNTPSFTNGNAAALHLNMINYIGLEDVDVCMSVFLTKLTAPANGTVLNAMPYGNLVGCTRKLAGPARSWLIPDRDEFGTHTRKFAVFPRFHGWAVDGEILNFVPGGFQPFHQVQLPGNATWHKINQNYNFEFDVNHDIQTDEGKTQILCHSTVAHNTLETLAQTAKAIEDANIHEPMVPAYHKVPRWTIPSKCFAEFSCRPLAQDKKVNGMPVIYGNAQLNMKVTHYTPTYYEGVPVRKFKDSHTKK